MPEPTPYRIDGMTCGGCVASVTRALERALPGVEFTVTLETGELRIAAKHDPAAVRAAIEGAGFDLAAS